MTWQVYEEYQKRRAALRRSPTQEAIAMQTKHPNRPRDPAQPAKPIDDIATEVEEKTETGFTKRARCGRP